MLKMKQIFVVVKEQFVYEHVNGNWVTVKLPNLKGFASEYNRDSERLNKKNSSLITGIGYRIVNDIIVSTTYDNVSGKHVTGPVPGNLLPRIYDNEPLTGFEISGFITRSSTANKLWNIVDPRGFELEVSTQNMKEIIFSCEIDKGKIVNECVWDFGKQGIGKPKLVRVK